MRKEPGATKPKCRNCGKEMYFLGERDRWYCYQDDQLYLARENVWVGDSPVMRVPWSEVYDMTIVPSCGKCGARMEPKQEGSGVNARARWVCPKHREHVFTEEQLEELRRKRTDMRPSYAILIFERRRFPRAWAGGEVTVEEISQRNEASPNSFKMDLVTRIVLGPYAAMHPRPVFYTANMDRAQRRIKKEPYRYPYSQFKADMLCPKCRTKVRADMEHCEQCGTKFVVPIPLYLSC